MGKLAAFFPALQWIKHYSKDDARSDIVASAIAAIILIPQSMGYAMLAGLPAVAGLYASIIPSIVYALFGSSRVLAVGPVAITSIMTATVALPLATPESSEYISIAIMLALLSGIFLFLLGSLKLGFLSNLLSYPVISGFISASAILIAVGQLKHMLGVENHGNNLPQLLVGLYQHLGDINTPTLTLSLICLVSLLLLKRYLGVFCLKMGLPKSLANIVGKSGPVIMVILSTTLVSVLSLDKIGVKVVGDIPNSLPSIQLPDIHFSLLTELLPGAILISIVGFVGSVSVAQSLAAKNRQKINPDQELISLGLANISAAFCAAFPVTGGLSRSVINVDAGAKTPMTGILTSLGIFVILMFMAPLFYHLPKAVLAVSICVAVLQLVNIGDFMRLWSFSKQEALLLIITFVVVLVIGMEAGIITGVILSLLFFLWHTSHPHIAVVGRIPGTEHFRNVQRHKVETHPSVLTIRIDENLFFANTRILEDKLIALIAENKEVKHVVLMCTAVNMIDASALESLEVICDRFHSAGITLHLSEVKGPIMDKLKGSHFMENLTGQIFLTQHQAMAFLCPQKQTS